VAAPADRPVRDRFAVRTNVSVTIGFVMRRCVLILSSRSGTWSTAGRQPATGWGAGHEP